MGSESSFSCRYSGALRFLQNETAKRGPARKVHSDPGFADPVSDKCFGRNLGVTDRRVSWRRRTRIDLGDLGGVTVDEAK